MRIQVIGPGCPKCKMLAERTEKAIQLLGLHTAVEKVTDINEMMQFGIAMTPALAIDGTIKLAGKVPSEAEIRTLLTSAMARKG
jgi:small redox-active disulfide protein 2